MADWNLIVAFALAVVALCLVPGPDMLFVLTNSVVRDARAGVLCAAGIGLVMVVHTAAAVLGLSVLFGGRMPHSPAWASTVARPECLRSLPHVSASLAARGTGFSLSLRAGTVVPPDSRRSPQHRRVAGAKSISRRTVAELEQFPKIGILNCPKRV